MGYTGRRVVIPAGQGGVTSDQNPTRIQPGQLIDGDGLLNDDGVARKEPGAELVDTTGLAGSPSIMATLGSAQAWDAIMSAHGVTGVPARTAQVTNSSTASGTTITATITNTINVGQVLAVAVAGIAVSSAVPTTVTDTKGNTYTRIGTQVNATVNAALFIATLTVQLVNGDVLTATFGGTMTARGIAVDSFSNTTGTANNSGTAADAGTAVTVTTGSLTVAPFLVIAAVANKVSSGAVTLTPSGSTSSGSRVETSAIDVGLLYRYESSTAIKTIIALQDWRPVAGTQRYVSAALDGGIYSDKASANDLDATTLVAAATLSTTARPGQFVNGGSEAAASNRKLFYFNGTNAPYVLSGDGATMSALANPNTDWSGSNQPSAACAHANRLAALGNANAPHRLYLSLRTDHEDFRTASGALTFEVYPGIGTRLAALCDYQGLLWLWKYPFGLFWLDDSDTDTANWALQQRSSAVGCANSPHAVLPVENDVMFLAADGSFHLLSNTREGGAVLDSDLSSLLRIDKWVRDHVNLARLSQVVSVWYPHKKLAIWGVPSTGSTNNDLVLYFNFRDVARGGAVQFTYSTRDNIDALALRLESDTIERPMLAEAGFVYLMDRTTRRKGAGAYTGSYQTPHLDLRDGDPRLAQRKKNFESLTLVQNPTSTAYDLTVGVYLDRTLTETLTFSTANRRQRLPLHGSGYEISLAVSNGDLDGDFQVVEHVIGFRDSDEGAI